MTTATIVLTLVKESCIYCHAIFGLEKEHHDQLTQHKGSFWCPSCRGEMSYGGETEAQKHFRARKAAEDQLARERAAFDQERAKLKEQIVAKESQRRAEKAAKTRLRKRAAVGVCPCCKRTFKQLASHIAYKHPGFVAEAKAE